MTPRKTCSTRSSGSGTRRPATTSAGSATTGCARPRCNGRAHPTAPTDRNPIRYRNDGVSQTSWSAMTAACPGWRSPPQAAVRCSSLARTCRRRRCPTPTTPSCSTPDAWPHQWHTMTKTGKVAKLNKLNPGPFVEIHPDDAARLEICDGDPVEIASRRGRAVLPAVSHRPGAARQLLCALPLERRVRRIPVDQRGHQRRRRPDLATNRNTRPVRSA